MKGKGILSRLTMALLLLALIVGTCGAALAVEKQVVILNTSDFHGNLLAGQKDRDGKAYGSSPVIAAYVAKYRAMYPGAVLLLDDGDMMQGPAISTVMRGKPVIEVYNAMGYAAAAIGNHEFDWGLATLAQRGHEAVFPFISANIFNKADGKRPDWVKPYAIFDVNGVKVAAIGLTTLQTPVVTLPDNVKTLEFRDPVTVVNALVPEVRAEGAQIVVLVAHIGGDGQGKLTEEIGELASAVKGVDLIVGGHTHTQAVGKVNDVPVLLPWYSGRAIGVSVLTFDTDASKVTSVEQKLQVTYAADVQPDAAVQAIIDRYNKDLAPVMAEVLAQAPHPMVRDYDHESAPGNLTADVMLKASGAQMAFTNAGGLRVDIPAGPLTLGKVWEFMPFDNTLVTMDLSGAKVREVLANKSKGMVQLAGLKFTYRDSGDKREILDVFLADGTPLDPGKTYKVVTNNFMATGGDNFTAFKSGTNVFDTNILIRDAIVNFLKAENAAGRVIAPVIEGRAVQIQ